MDNKENANILRALKPVRSIYEFLEMVVFAATITMLLFMFVGRLTVVSGGSMMNTLIDDEVLVATNVNYTPQRGDIVVLQSPEYYEEPIVKRVIAIGGETIDIDFDNWIVYINGEPLYTESDGITPTSEPYVNFENSRMLQDSRVEFPMVVPEGEVFVMGDNRNHSSDSRIIGTIDERYIFGKVICRLTPLSKFGAVK